MPDQVLVLEPAGLSAEPVPVSVLLPLVVLEQRAVLQEPTVLTGTTLAVLH